MRRHSYFTHGHSCVFRNVFRNRVSFQPLEVALIAELGRTASNANDIVLIEFYDLSNADGRTARLAASRVLFQLLRHGKVPGSSLARSLTCTQ